VAYTMAGLALLGIKSDYIGKVKDDHLGKVYASHMKSIGVEFTTKLASAHEEYETGRSVILVTPDGERSMNTYLGAAEFLTIEDMDRDLLGNAEWIYLEGYRFDGPESQEAFRIAVEQCKTYGGKVSLALSDPFCIERHRPAFWDLIKSGTDLIFANRSEILSLCQTNDLERALEILDKEDLLVVATLSEDGVIVAGQGNKIKVDAVPTKIVDATGAGDQFAAGFFYGISEGLGLETSARLGCLAASEVISHVGPRPEENLLPRFRETV
ncbi:MAG: adenosine kinase, partial [Rhodobacteraceae bacterium]|nr:adenosine kinase [Paracoccaceae bacterium]